MSVPVQNMNVTNTEILNTFLIENCSMSEAGVLNGKNITDLPNEIITLILQNNNAREICNFGETCKQYNDMVKNNAYLWKNKCKTMFDYILFKSIEECHNSNWLQEMKNYNRLKKILHSELIAMSPKHYWDVSEMTIDHVKHFFHIAAKYGFFYAIHIIQDVIKTGNKLIDKYVCKKPYTLTEMYYAKIVARYFIHTYLAVKWVKSKAEQTLKPESVINFFLQWIDPGNMYLDDIVNEKIDILVGQVKNILEKGKDSCEGCHCNLKLIMLTTYYVVFKERHITLTTAADIESINICKVIDNRYGNMLVVAVIYQAVAKRVGADCDLIVLPGYFYIQWLDRCNPKEPEPYVIDLDTGEVIPKHQYTQNDYIWGYSPDHLLQFIYSLFIVTMGEIRNWHTQNALHLVDFLSSRNDHTNYRMHTPYKVYNNYLIEHASTLVECSAIDVRQLAANHIQAIMSLVNLGKPIEVRTKKKVAKKHAGKVKYAVGMICYHKKYDYVCIIRDWDLSGCHVHFSQDDLYFGRNQPFYYITAADQSARYVAQENLMELTRPNRLYHLEHQISIDFTHFDGFAYIPNDQKRSEYPEDERITEVFRNACVTRPDNM